MSEPDDDLENPPRGDFWRLKSVRMKIATGSRIWRSFQESGALKYLQVFEVW